MITGYAYDDAAHTMSIAKGYGLAEHVRVDVILSPLP